MSEPFVYIAGKYNDENDDLIRNNIESARALAIQCAKHNIKHFCPHTHSDFMHKHAPEAKHDFWINLDTDVIKKLCNCMLMVEGWESSGGARFERYVALELKYPVFYSFKKLKEWIVWRNDSV